MWKRKKKITIFLDEFEFFFFKKTILKEKESIGLYQPFYMIGDVMKNYKDKKKWGN